MKHRWSAAAAILALCTALPAHAVPPTHSYVDLAFLAGEDDSLGTSDDYDGVRAATSISIQRWLNFTAEYDYRQFDRVGDARTDNRTGALGFGLHSLRSDFQLISAFTYEWADTNISSPSGGTDNREEGYGVLVGVRAPLFNRFDVQIDYKYLDYGKDEFGTRIDDSRLRFVGQAHIFDNLSVVATYQTYDEAERDEYTVGLRLYFNTQYDRIRSLDSGQD